MRSPRLADVVEVADNRGFVGTGYVIGKSFSDPRRFDVRIDGVIHSNLPHSAIRLLNKEEIK